jgi:hypothetical protein
MDRDEILHGYLEDQSDLIGCEEWQWRHDAYDISYLHALWSGFPISHYDPILCSAAHRYLDETSRDDLSYKIPRNAIRQRMDADRVLRWNNIEIQLRITNYEL